MGMGFEGHSKAVNLLPMDPIRGGRSEYKYLLAILIGFPIIATFRKSNEDSLRAAQGVASNKYARMPVAELSKAL